MADIAQILENTQNPNASIRQEAEQLLAASKTQHFGMFLTSLTAVLVEEGKSISARMAAGLMLKNELSSPNEMKRKVCEENWLKLEPAMRENIKNGILQSLGSPVVFGTAAQVVSSIAQIEVPKNLWPTLIEILLQNTLNANVSLKKGTLQALGYICEEINPRIVETKAKDILTAITFSLRDEETDFGVKSAAAKALDNALEFAKNNFQVLDDRNYIMSMVERAVRSTNLEVKVAGYECLVKIASLYYNFLPQYMQSLLGLTLESIKKEEESVALQAIEFWSTICDEEIYLIEETVNDSDTPEVAPAVGCYYFVKGALPFLLPVVLETLTKQDEDADSDQWDIAMAGATCLTLIANCVANDILGPIYPFITQNLNNTEWHLREAATMAFGSILEGTHDLTAFIQQALPYLLQHLQSDPMPLVKDTTAWTIGRICQFHPTSIKGDYINFIMGPLLAALNDAPKVASNACWALNNIAENFRHEDTKPAADFTNYFRESVNGLLAAAERTDTEEISLRASAYEAINEFIQAAEEECIEFVMALVPVFQGRLDKTFTAQILTKEDRDTIAETQGLLCSLLQNCTQKLEKEIVPVADGCAALYLKVFATKSATAFEEALMAFSALANALEVDFTRYMPHFNPFLLQGLKAWEEYRVCTIAVGVVGDVCRALDRNVLEYCNEYVAVLVTSLQDTRVHKSCKPAMLSCIGDIAMAIGGEFARYLEGVMGIILQVTSFQVDRNDDDMVDYQNELRETLFEAITGILQGLRSDDKADAFLPYTEGLVAYVTESIFRDDCRSEGVARGAIGVLGDLAQTLGSKSKPYLDKPAVRDVLKQCLHSDKQSIYEITAWAQAEIITKNS